MHHRGLGVYGRATAHREQCETRGPPTVATPMAASEALVDSLESYVDAWYAALRPT